MDPSNAQTGPTGKYEYQRTGMNDEKGNTKKKVKDLTTEERMVLINEAKNGIENPFFKVQFYKNGNSRIIKRKQPIQQTSEKIIKTKAPSLTTEQLLMEHVIGLESQLATMKQKQKKLKRKYNSLYQDIYVDVDEVGPDTYGGSQEVYKDEIENGVAQKVEMNQNNSINTTATTTALSDTQDNSVNQNENLHCEHESEPNIFKRDKRGWRAKIAQNMIKQN